MGTMTEEEERDLELDRKECAEKKCMYSKCKLDGHPTVTTAIWSYYHGECYDLRQKEIWGD